MATSSISRQVSTSSLRYSNTLARIARSVGTVMPSVSARSAVTSSTTHCASLSSESHTKAFISTRSIMPLKLSSEPIGSCTGSGRELRRLSIMSTQRVNEAPLRSILLT